MIEVNTLTINFVGDPIVMEPGEQLIFGRDARLRLDEGDNRYLHRSAGKFLWYGEMWWLENLGRSIELVLRDVSGVDEKSIRPAHPPEPLTRQAGVVWLSSGTRQYQLEYTQSRDPLPPRSQPPVFDGERTWTLENVALGECQRLLLTALAERRLRGERSPSALPRNKDVAIRLGWPITTFNRRLDGLCTLFTDVGIDGLIGSEEQRATNRREILVEHVLQKHLIKPADLSRLD